MRVGQSRRQGFTLPEIMMVVALIGLVATIAVPTFARSRRLAQNSATVNALRVAAAAFEQAEISSGAYPPETMPSVIPKGMSESLSRMNWTGPTPVGGQWDWDYMQFSNKVGVSIYFGNNSQNERMAEIDAAIDDGNLDTGLFRRHSRGYIYIIEQR
jgi:prepilin-type N-terminal cleavage/methylation domain-containing protein